ncbi:MAG: hypothetical protein ACRDXX_09865 [Stackebrandtia sp.]
MFGTIATAAIMLATAACNQDLGDDDVSVEFDLPSFELDDKRSVVEWKPRIVNGSGEDLSDAVLSVAVAEPGDGMPAIEVFKDAYPLECETYSAEDGESVDLPPAQEASCGEHLPPNEKCEFPGGVNHDGGGVGRTARCVRDLAPGENEYWLELKLDVSNMDADGDKLVNYPDLSVQAELSVGENVLASAESTLDVTGAAKYGRLTFDDVPEQAPSDRAYPNGFDWTFTVANDSDTDVEDAKFYVRSGSDLALSTGRENCRWDDMEDDPLDSHIDCEDVDIPAGESVTVSMRLYVYDPFQSLADNCEQEDGDCVQRELLTVDVYDGEYRFAAGETEVEVVLVE